MTSFENNSDEVRWRFEYIPATHDGAMRLDELMRHNGARLEIVPNRGDGGGWLAATVEPVVK